MKIPSVPSSEITPEATFMNRRELLRIGTTAAIGAALAGCPAAEEADAPIRNYDQLTAKDVVARVQRLSGPQATAVLDYERSRKKRATVIRAVEKRLAAAS